MRLVCEHQSVGNSKSDCKFRFDKQTGISYYNYISLHQKNENDFPQGNRYAISPVRSHTQRNIAFLITGASREISFNDWYEQVRDLAAWACRQSTLLGGVCTSAEIQGEILEKRDHNKE